MTTEITSGVRRNPDEINDRRLEEIRATEFGLPPSNYEGRFGNGAPFALFIGEVLIKLQSILSLYRRPLRFLHRRIQFLKNFVLFSGEFFDAVGLFWQCFQHDVLPL